MAPIKPSPLPVERVRLLRPLSVLLLLSLALNGCNDDGKQAPDPAPAVKATALRLVFPGDVEGIICNGRKLECVRLGDTCTFDLDAAAQGWGDTAVMCHGLRDEALFAPLLPLVFKNGLPAWTPNLDVDGNVVASARTTAVGTAFLSPYLVAVFPETARALLGQTDDSRYLDELIAAIEARDRAQTAAAIGPVVRDVLAQLPRTQALSSISRGLGMKTLEVDQTGGFVTIEANLGTPVDHICAIYAVPSCAVPSAVAFGEVEPAESFTGKVMLGRVFVPSKSFFKLQNIAKAALGELFGDLLPMEALETIRLEPGQVHDIQCYSGALGLYDEQDRRADAALIAAEPDGQFLMNFARVSNLISLAIDSLRLFVDFEAFTGNSKDLAQAISICAEEALGPALAVADDATREEWFNLVKVIQTCAVKRLGVVLARRGLHALAAFVFDFATDGGGGVVGKISRIGQLLDRVLGMTVIMSPVQRQLIANKVDFDACTPCEDSCPAVATRACLDRTSYHDCELTPSDRENVAGCLEWIAPIFCGEGWVCEGEGTCVECGGLGQPCCATDSCDAGNACDDGVCVAGCQEECPAVGAVECANSGALRECGETDGDPCLEWTVTACEVGEVCVDGACGPPLCESVCEPGAVRCAGDVVERCGECDDDPCNDWCEPIACDERFVCADGACVCDQAQPDLPSVFPGAQQDAIDDSGVAILVQNSLYPEGDIDLISAYITDRVGDTLRPRIAVSQVERGLTYDLCIAYQCDPNVNDGAPTSVDCGDAIRTTRDQMPACCLLSQRGDAAVEIRINCTLGGLSDDSGTAYAYVESVVGAQCTPPLRLTLTGGND